MPRYALALLSFFLTSSIAFAQPAAPLYEECRIDSIYPAGGQRGTSVKIQIRGYGSNMSAPKDLIIDGPPGITVAEVKSVDATNAQATLVIAADAPFGRRWLRVLNERSGLTNFAHFVVGGLAEQIEDEPKIPNNTVETAQVAQIPTVLNGRIDPAADLDVYRFSGKKDQRIVAAIAAHAIDIHGQYKNYGIADFSLELLDSDGRTLATAEDTLGFDPLIEHVLPRDGDYLIRVQLLNYQGFPEAIYRLTLGEVPYLVGAFPPGYRRGTATEIELFGPNIPPGTRRLVGKPSTTPSASGWLGEEAANWDPAFVLRHVSLEQAGTSGLDVPLVAGDLPESIEAEPNDDRTQISLLQYPCTVNGRFQRSDDADWYRIHLEPKQKVSVEIIAQRYIKSPVDTLLQLFDAQGQLVAENDDEAFDPGYECYQDFKTTDSKLLYTATAAGDFFIKVSEQSGVNGPRAIYRLTVKEDQPDFRLTHFPDAIPIWGPGSTACVMVRIDRFSGFNENVDISVEGLPTGWSTRSATSLATTPERPFVTYQFKVFLSITAPSDAPIGTCFPIRIVGRAKQPDGTMIERGSIPLNLFYSSDTGFFRATPISRVAVAKSQGPWLEAVTQEVSIVQGGSGTLTVKTHGAGDLKTMPVVVNLATYGVAAGLVTPQNLPITDGRVDVPIKLPPELYPGSYGITVAQTWRSDIRTGMPGPCTALIKLTVLPAK